MSATLEVIVPDRCIPCRYDVHAECEGAICACDCQPAPEAAAVEEDS